MAHRGAGGAGRWAGQVAVLGYQGKAVAHAAQPVQARDGRKALVIDGILFNAPELREQLAGQPLAADSDAGLVLAAWERWGPACLDRLDGLFAFAVWDEDARQLVLARDRFGEKPLYYSEQGGALLFASELRALLASGAVGRELDAASLADHLRHGAVHAPATIVKDVRMLPPGHLARWAEGKIQVEPWWQMAGSVDGTAVAMDRQEVVREVREHFFRAVQRQMATQEPFGAFLSGGIDSSAVVGAMAGMMEEPLHTFTVTFDEAEFSEARFARMIAEKFGTKHTEVRLKPTEMLDFLPAAMAAMDHPSSDGPNTWVVGKVVKEAGMEMAFSGLGGDELFAGYQVFRRSYRLLRLNALTVVPRPVRALVGKALAGMRSGVAGWKSEELLNLPSWQVHHTYPLSRLAFHDRQLRTLLAGPLPPDVVAADVRALLTSGPGQQLGPLSQVSIAELSTYVPDMLLRDSDQMGMAHGLRILSPFMDHRLVAFALGIPDKIKYPHTPKQLFTDALGDLLPREVTHRPKRGFTLPWDHWMRNELRDYCHVRIQALAARPQFRAEGVLDLWKRFLNGDPGATFMRLWTLVALEEWLTLNRVN